MAISGESKYEFEPGYVLRLHKTRTRYNTFAEAKMRHRAYIWVQRKGILHKGRQEKDRIHHVLYCFVPVVKGMEGKSMVERRKVQRETITKQLKTGYDVVSKNVTFNYTDWAYENFYKAIGLI